MSIFFLTPKKSSLFRKVIILKIRKSKTHGDNLRNHLDFFKMEEEEAIIKGIENNETRYLYKAETGYMNLIQTSDHGKCNSVCLFSVNEWPNFGYRFAALGCWCSQKKVRGCFFNKA